MSITNNAAWEIPQFTVGVIEANVDMSAEATWQLTGVSFAPATGSGLLGLAAVVRGAAGGPMDGILQNNPLLAEAAQVMTEGVSKAKAGGAFAAGALLMVDASGLLVTATTGNFGVAKALQPSAGSGQVVSVYLRNFGKQ